MNINDGTFYMVQLPGDESIHNERSEALDHLRANANGVNPETDDVSVVEVNVSGEDWSIKELSWQSVALELLGGGDDA